MGSACGDKHQLDGVGGATSTTSKVAVVSKSKRPDADVDYTFAQVAVGSRKVDFSGNCGNIASGVGPFALDEGLVLAKPGQKEIDIRVFNTNTKRLLVETIQVDRQGRFQEEGDFQISGFDGSGSRIKINFINPAGSLTGKLFPTGNRQDTITIPVQPRAESTTNVRVSLVDAGNPFIFVHSGTLPELYHQLGPDEPACLDLIESIRRKGAVLFGLAPNEEAASHVRGTPKIAVLSAPKKCVLFAGDRFQEIMKERPPDIAVTAFSMGKVHPSLPLTGAVCLATATSVPGTVAFELQSQMQGLSSGKIPRSQSRTQGQEVCILQRSGKTLADVQITYPEMKVEGVCVSRTAQRLFEGNVMLKN
ncbi:MAG: hypothetical protein LQ342_005010 [Letrouitia transgressa]|nr:MAG: hypothetical protein LQ342_005010 [Letrouitia transgressa]